MKKNHIILLETKDHGWIAYSVKKADAQRILNVNKQHKIYYIFEYDLDRHYPYTMKLKAPIQKHYDCTNIIKYKDEIFEESDEFLTVSYEDPDDGVCFTVKKN